LKGFLQKVADTRFWVLTAVSMKMHDFWIVTSLSLVKLTNDSEVFTASIIKAMMKAVSTSELSVDF
jgi:hypothetical protein